MSSSLGALVPLSPVATSDPGVVGGKAAALMRGWGIMPVPQGVVATTGVFDEITAQVNDRVSGLLDVTTAEPTTMSRFCLACVETLPLPHELANSLLDQFPHSAALAVRSSSPSEDLMTASSAGVYESVLGVRGAEQLNDAIRRCLASVYQPRALTYRRRMGLPVLKCHMAVLVQQMLEPETAGVMFTKHPVTNDTTQTVIESVPGLGVGVVDGRVTPDRLIVSRVMGPDTSDFVVVSAERRHRVGISELDADRLAHAGAELASRFGFPVDVEWAKTSDGELWLLQVRPIST